MSEIIARVAANVKAVRERKNLSVADCADNIGVAATNWYAIEQGRRNLSIKSLEEIAKVLGVDVSTLFRKPKSEE